MNIQEQQALIESTILTVGKHESREKGVCVMELVAWLAGESHTDFPECVDRGISRVLQKFNDRMNLTDRNKYLKPLLLKVIGSNASLEIRIKRAFVTADWTVRIILPTAFDLMGKKEWAKKLRVLAPIIDIATAKIARDKTQEVKVAAYAAATTATAAAAAAAAAAAGDVAAAVAYAGDVAAAAAYAGDAAAGAYAGDAAAYAATAADDAGRLEIWPLAVNMIEAMIAIK